MREFDAIKTYSVLSFDSMQSWFGNRGIDLQDEALNEWCCDGYFLYFTCGKNAPDEITPCEGDENVMVCIFDSICYECYEEIEYSFSPFARKVKK